MKMSIYKLADIIADKVADKVVEKIATKLLSEIQFDKTNKKQYPFNPIQPTVVMYGVGIVIDYDPTINPEISTYTSTTWVKTSTQDAEKSNFEDIKK